jgi:hypothetical protein
LALGEQVLLVQAQEHHLVQVCAMHYDPLALL